VSVNNSTPNASNGKSENALRSFEQFPLPKPDLLVFSHLRWDFVYQRPQHLLKRSARDRRVFFVEEPVFDNGSMRLEISEREENLKIVVPHLPEGLRSEVAKTAVLHDMVQRLLLESNIHQYLAWYYTPMALDFTRHLRPMAVIYDCMDELSGFKGAPESLTHRERELFKLADLVFTGGQTLYEAKRNQHDAVFAFPSSIDRHHFMQARTAVADPADQQDIPHPRLGFFGVVDERFDVELLDEVSRQRPDWHFVIIGPVVKIDPAILPQRENIHYLGGKSYQDLPGYIAGWDVALLLFAQNESTRFISPTKTPEYLAAGKPVVSTPIRDVVCPYGQMGLVRIANDAQEFIAAAEDLLGAEATREKWLGTVDEFLATMSWDETWARMSRLIDDVLVKKTRTAMVAKASHAHRNVAA
jgi:UDP-galactopyranose mutase